MAVPTQKAGNRENQHLQRAAQQHHAGAAGGIVQPFGKITAHDDEHSSLLADPARRVAHAGEQAVVDGCQHARQQYQQRPVRGQAAQTRSGSDGKRR